MKKFEEIFNKQYKDKFKEFSIKVSEDEFENIKDNLPGSGLYVVYDNNNGKIIYIGQSTNLKTRIKYLIKSIKDGKNNHSGGEKINKNGYPLNKLTIQIFSLNEENIEEQTAKDLLKYLEAKAIFENRESENLLND